MTNTPLLLSSPAPLPDEAQNQWHIYLISAGIGGFLGLLTLNPFLFLLLGLLGFGVGWGISDKLVRAKCLYLRRLRFYLPAPLTYPELYTRLSSLLAPMNIPVTLTTEGNVCVSCNGLSYTIFYCDNTSFTISWSQPFGKSLLNEGFYLKLYKNLITAMGFIGFYTQQACYVAGN